MNRAHFCINRKRTFKIFIYTTTELDRYDVSEYVCYWMPLYYFPLLFVSVDRIDPDSTFEDIWFSPLLLLVSQISRSLEDKYCWM